MRGGNLLEAAVVEHGAGRTQSEPASGSGVDATHGSTPLIGNVTPRDGVWVVRGRGVYWSFLTVSAALFAARVPGYFLTIS